MHVLVHQFEFSNQLPVVIITSDMSPRDIDEVVLVGGSTRIPKIKADLRYHCVVTIIFSAG